MQMSAGLHCQFEETFEDSVPYEHSFYSQLELYKKGMFQEILRSALHTRHTCGI